MAIKERKSPLFARKRICVAVLLFLLVATQSGCTTLGSLAGSTAGGLFNLAEALIGGTFKLVGQAIETAIKMPKPTPYGIF